MRIITIYLRKHKLMNLQSHGCKKLATSVSKSQIIPNKKLDNHTSSFCFVDYIITPSSCFIYYINADGVWFWGLSKQYIHLSVPFDEEEQN